MAALPCRWLVSKFKPVCEDVYILSPLNWYNLIMKKLLAGFIVVTVSLFLITPSVSAARPSGGTTTKTPLGIDVSWPQCGKKLPSGHAFAIVGVNGGLANTTNECLKEQLIWANKAVGGTPQEKVQLYVNTANPGGLNTESWPKMASPENPYVTCDGSDSLGCAWQYGWNRALEDARDRFAPAVAETSLVKDPAYYLWWLDVETENTWKLSGSTFDTQSNVVVLEGMTAYFKSIGARVGLYSTGQQWGQIAGNSVTSTSNLNKLINWRPGGANLVTARQACGATALTAGGSVVLTQFVSKNLDYNYSCI